MEEHFHFAISGMERIWGEIKNGKLPVALNISSDKSFVLFSSATLEKFIEEDFRHGGSELSGERSIRTYSTGEKRKALLEHLLLKNPDILILDSPFDALDEASVKVLKKRLKEVSADIRIIQLLKRKEDLPEFIDHILMINEKEESKLISLSEFQRNQNHSETGSENLDIPPPLKPFENISKELVLMKNVSVNYNDRPILQNINWQIKKGEFWQLSGPNGSGKSTLLSMIYGDNPKAYGQEIYLFGRKKGSGESVWEIKKKIG